MMLQKLKQTLLLTCLLTSVSINNTFAGTSPDEGMWLANLVSQMNMKKLQQMGLQLSADEIYSVNNPSLKDAIVQLGQGSGGFCTAELVSANGLLFTNHHCGFEALASVSTTENNYIDDGYWAMSYAEEIPIPGLWIRIVMNVIDITDSIIPRVEGLDVASAKGIVSEVEGRMIERYAAEGYEVEVKAMYDGNQYYVYLYKQFNDVRFAGAPPSSIGNFGGDTDNWMWPRHTGDFSVFRVYADKENNPAEYSTDNVPYSPKKYLKISLDGYSEGDFAMIMGYPGSTERYLSSAGIKDVINETNPALVDCFQTVTDVMKQQMDKDDSIRILFAAEYAQFMNALKLFKTQIDGMKHMDAVAIKQAEEKEFKKWAASRGKEEAKTYETMFADFESAYNSRGSVTRELYYKRYAIFLTSAGNLALTMQEAESLFGDDVTDEQKEEVKTSIREQADETWKTYNLEAEKNKAKSFLILMYEKLPSEKYPQTLNEIIANGTGNSPKEKIDNWVDAAFAKSVFSTKEKLETFLSSPKKKKLDNDPLYKYFNGLFEESSIAAGTYRAANQQLNELQKQYMAALMEKGKGTAFYPDANSTFRLTYGSVQDYSPRDAVQYDWQTTLNGVIEKMDSTDAEFIVPAKLYELYQQKDYGRYADKNGNMPVCFLSNLDITGGNSGSPIMNGKGELIGLAFDGNYEGTPGEYIFDPAMNRTISVDIRYVLFVIDKFAGAQNLIKELSIAK